MAASIREIKTRIVGTEKTSQITKAMNVVSAAKLKKAEKKIKDYIPFMEKVEEIVTNIISQDVEEIEHSMLVEREVKKRGYIIVTSDRGLAGSFNNGLLKKVLKDIKENETDESYQILALGTKGYSFCKKNNLNCINESAKNLSDNVLFTHIIDDIREMIKLFDSKEVDEVVIYYNHFVNTMTQDVTRKTLLPVTNLKNDNNESTMYEYDQKPNDIINLLLPTYIENTMYGIILDSKASEHASRMTAMTSATDNAQNVIKELQIIYNRARQSAITLELTDIVGGANAVE